MRLQVILALLAALGFGTAALPSAAQTACDAPVADGDIAGGACTIVTTFTAVVGGAPVTVTVVADSALGVAAVDVGPVRAAVDRSGLRLTELAIAGFPDITIALAGGLGDGPDVDGATHIVGGDCVVALDWAGLRSDVGLLQHSTAHEMFHCAQYVLQPGLTDLVSSAWWSEGSAEWFANLTYPGTAYSAGWVADFDARSAGEPVTAMDYPAVVLFAWLGQVRGPGGVVDLVRGVTGSAGDLAAAVGEDGWWQFVDAYFDQTIRWPGGAALPSAPQRGPSFTFADSRRETLQAERYVLYRADLVFEAGYWVLESDPASGRYHVGAGGQQLPDAIETGCEEPTRYELRGSGIGTDGFRLAVDATLEEEAACAGCVEAPEFDRCLVGSWQFTAGGAADWLQRNLPPDVVLSVASPGNPNMTFRRNGTYRATMAGLGATITTEDGYGEVDASTVAAGRWSTSGATLHICEDALAPSGTITVEIEGISQSMPFASFVGPGASLALDYSCSGDLLITELRFPGIPDPMVTNYTRIAAPPAR